MTKIFMMSEIRKVFNFNQKFLLKKSQRALDEAYDAALKIKYLENEHFQANNYSNELIVRSRVTHTERYSVSISDSPNYISKTNLDFQMELKKCLEIITFKLLEFEPILSTFDIFEISDCYLIIHKLKIIDDIFIQYHTQQTNLLDLNNLALLNNTGLKSQEYQKSFSFKNNHIKPELEETSVLQEKISETVDKIINKLSVEPGKNMKIRSIFLFFIILFINSLVVNQLLLLFLNFL